jgi:hypothetical protein
LSGLVLLNLSFTQDVAMNSCCFTGLLNE